MSARPVGEALRAGLARDSRSSARGRPRRHRRADRHRLRVRLRLRSRSRLEAPTSSDRPSKEPSESARIGRASPLGSASRIVHVEGTLPDGTSDEDRKGHMTSGCAGCRTTPTATPSAVTVPPSHRAHTHVEGGRAAYAHGRLCSCTGLLATAGLARCRVDNACQEPALVAAGSDCRGVRRLIGGLRPTTSPPRLTSSTTRPRRHRSLEPFARSAAAGGQPMAEPQRAWPARWAPWHEWDAIEEATARVGVTRVRRAGRRATARTFEPPVGELPTRWADFRVPQIPLE